MKKFFVPIRFSGGSAGLMLSLLLVCPPGASPSALGQDLPSSALPPPLEDLPLPVEPEDRTPPGILTPEQGKVVRSVEVRFRGPHRLDRERILSNMRLKPGEIYTRDKEEDDLRALYNTGDLLDVQIGTADVAGGVRVIVTVEARASLGEIEFRGNSALSAERLRLEANLKVGGSVNDLNLAQAKESILSAYRAKGFTEVTVDYDVLPGATPGFSRVVFTINEGGRSIIRNVVFEGAATFSHRQLARVTVSDNRNWLKFWNLKRRVEREKIDQDVKAIEEFYQDRGYLDARVTNVTPRRVDDERVDLVFQISEGPQYTVASVSVTGNKLYTAEELIPVFQLESGAVFSRADMLTDLQTIDDYYGARGYAEKEVLPRINKLPGNQLEVVYAIEEGSQFKIGKINISGNQKTREEVIRRELTFAPGEDYNSIKIRRSQQRLRALKYFDPGPGGVDFMPVTSDLGPDYKDINIDLKEIPTGQVMFGAGFSSIDNVVGLVEVTQQNFDVTNWPSFTGAGQRFRLGIKAGTRRKDFILSLTEPWFMGERLALGGELFYTDKTYLSDRYEQRNIGGSVSLRKPVGDHSDVRLSYTAQQVEIFDVDSDASDLIKREEGDYFQSKLTAGWVYDTRNDVIRPSKGHQISVEGMLSGGFLGGDVDALGLTLSAQKHWQLPWDMIFSLNGSISSTDTWGDGDRVPIFERQFLGGANDLRGFDYRDVGPKDEDGEPIGGLTSAYISAEVTFPIVSSIRGAVFADAGVVNSDAWDLSLSDYNADIGLGLRFTLPILGQMPIKIDYGIPVVSDEHNDSNGRFNFGVDYKF